MNLVILANLQILVNLIILIFYSGDSGDFDDSRDSSEICVQMCYFGEIGVSRKYGDSGDGCEYWLFWQVCQFW